MSETSTCIHCGADCGKHPIISNEKAFCCNGCLSVYQLLHDNKLYKYYEIDNQPGVRLDKPAASERFEYLDHEDIKSILLDFTDSGISKVTLYIPSIHCSSCIWLLENLHKLHRGVLKSDVHFIKKEVYITYKDAEISLRQLVELLASVHYVPLITLKDADQKQDSHVNRKLLYKIGVAGFAFGNTMLLSFPEYIPGNELLEESFRRTFGYLNLLLALPVFFYSASDYLLSAFKNLRKAIITIDLPISIGMLAIFIQSAFDILSGSGAGYMDSLCGFVFFILIGKWYQNKTYQSLSFERNYKSYFPLAVTLTDKTGDRSIPLDQLKTGDRIRIRNQELIPADSILIEGEGEIDYSFVTGESASVYKVVGEEIYAGGRQKGQSLVLEVVKEVKQSKLTQLWNQDSRKRDDAGLKTLIDKVSKHFTLVVIGIALLTAAYWLIQGSTGWITIFTAVLIVACPCALSLSLPFAFGSVMRALGRGGFYLKKADVVEQLTQIDTVVFDKTGTITLSGEAMLDFVSFGADLSELEKNKIKSLVQHSAHPLSVAVYKFLENNESIPLEEYREITGRGVSGKINGEIWRAGSVAFVYEGLALPQNGWSQVSSVVFVRVNEEVKGYFTIKNKYREGLQSLIHAFSKKYKLHVLTGDNESEKENLKALFGVDTVLQFNQSPSDKLQYISKLKKEGKKVLMIGDGLNDAGALMESHTGISIADDVYQFSPACDAILTADRFMSLPNYLLLARDGMKIVRISFVISLLYNSAGLWFAVQGMLSPIVAAILMPASSVTVVAFVTAATALAALRREK